MSIPGDVDASRPVQRHWKFQWQNLSELPSKGKIYRRSLSNLFRMYQEGKFRGFDVEAFPLAKRSHRLGSAGRCVYCGRTHDAAATPLKLTSEHVVPEFLGAGTELGSASCSDCQTNTASFEHALSEQLFATSRNALGIRGKSGPLDLRHVRVDLGGATPIPEVLPEFHHPTILILPFLYPAAAYSSTPPGLDHPFAFWMYNINADKDFLEQYGIDAFSTDTVDQIKFAQLLAKIAHVYASYFFGIGSFAPALTKFIRTDYPFDMQNPPRDFYSHVGCLGQCRDFDGPSQNLHEIQAGIIEWNGRAIKTVRVRLFAVYDMPSYFIAVE